MKPRHRANVRLTRSSPGERTGGMRPLAERLYTREARGDRDLELPIPQRELVFERRTVPLPRYKLADPSPNAPLLKRVVRHPYALEPLGTQRISLIDPELSAVRHTDSRPQREPVQVVFALSRAARDRATIISAGGPEERAHPFVRRRENEQELVWVRALGEGSCLT